MNKAQKGELRFPLPVGFCYDDQGRTVVDPDDEVRGAVQLVFRLFQETGSAYAVVQRSRKMACASPSAPMAARGRANSFGVDSATGAY